MNTTIALKPITLEKVKKMSAEKLKEVLAETYSDTDGKMTMISSVDQKRHEVLKEFLSSASGCPYDDIILIALDYPLLWDAVVSNHNVGYTEQNRRVIEQVILPKVRLVANKMRAQVRPHLKQLLKSLLDPRKQNVRFL